MALSLKNIALYASYSLKTMKIQRWLPVLYSIAAAIFQTLVCFNSEAQELKKTFGAWGLYTLKEQKGAQCYLLATPASKSSVFLMVARRNPTTYEVSVHAGQPLSQKNASLRVDNGKQYTLFSKGSIAWAKDQADDRGIISDMKNGKRAKIEIAAKGKPQSTIFLLQRFNQAFKALQIGSCR